MKNAVRKFDKVFLDPLPFNPEGIHISRRAYTRQEAAVIIQEELFDGDDVVVDPNKLEESWVRWTFQNFTDELPSPCWLVCGKNDNGAQPTWEYP